jgi:hypothetical protein
MLDFFHGPYGCGDEFCSLLKSHVFISVGVTKEAIE